MSLYKNVASQKLAVFAWDTVNNSPKTGDAANITAQVSKDGGATAASNDANPTELDATDAPGVYLFDLTQAETNCDLFVLFAVSSTTGIELDPVIVYTSAVTTTRAGYLDELAAANMPSDIDDLINRLTAVRAGYLDNLSGGAVALASVVGALADAAAAGDPTSADTLMQYVKQLINTLEGTAGIPAYPASADPADNVSLAEAIRAIRDDVTGIAGEAMRGTDSGATAASLTTHDGKLDTVDANVDAILVDTGTTLDAALAVVDGNVDSILADTAEIGAAGVGLTEAGGTGDHLTAINLPNQTMDITGDITGNLSGSVGSVTAEVDADITKISGDATAADTLELFCEILNQSTGQLDNGSMDATLDTYQGKCTMIDDDTGTTDLYTFVWFKNGEPVTSGITSPTIQVIKVSDGTDLVGSTAMTQIGALGMYKHAETSNRITDGDGYIGKFQATIGGSTQTWYQPVGRDD